MCHLPRTRCKLSARRSQWLLSKRTLLMWLALTDRCWRNTCSTGWFFSISSRGMVPPPPSCHDLTIVIGKLSVRWGDQCNPLHQKNRSTETFASRGWAALRRISRNNPMACPYWGGLSQAAHLSRIHSPAGQGPPPHFRPAPGICVAWANQGIRYKLVTRDPYGISFTRDLLEETEKTHGGSAPIRAGAERMERMTGPDCQSDVVHYFTHDVPHLISRI